LVICLTSRDQINPQDQSIKASNLFGFIVLSAATWQAGWVQNTKRPGVVLPPQSLSKAMFEEVCQVKKHSTTNEKVVCCQT
jgi:hypothetical protein